VLALHPSVFAASETLDWVDAVQQVRAAHGNVEPFPCCVPAFTPDHLAEISRLHREKIKKRAGEANFIINTAPAHMHHVGLIYRVIPRAKIIYFTRDAFDNALLMYFYNYAYGNTQSNDLNNIANYYTQCRRVMTHWLKLYGDRVLTIAYENLVRQPLETAKRLYDHCGLDFDLAKLELSFRDDEIGHWKHYEKHLSELKAWLAAAADQSIGEVVNTPSLP
jgi:hypothetical protein